MLRSEVIEYVEIGTFNVEIQHGKRIISENEGQGRMELRSIPRMDLDSREDLIDNIIEGR
jgi:hypothetical protein